MIEPATVEDLVVFAGPSLQTIETAGTAPRIDLDRSFREDPSVAHDFTLVARDIGRVVQIMFEDAPPPVDRPIVCWIGGPLPLTLSTANDRYIFIRIALTKLDLRQRNYCRFAYQLGHELGHVYLDARRSNGLIETLADCIAYQCLDRLAWRWNLEAGGNLDVKSYAPLFLKYRDMKTAEKMKALPAEIVNQLQTGKTAIVRAFLEQHNQELDAFPYTKKGLALRSLAAAIFPRETNWAPFAGLAAVTDPPPSRDGRYREGFPTEIDRAPKPVQDALRAIGRP